MMFLVAGKGAHWVEAIQVTCRVFGENLIHYRQLHVALITFSHLLSRLSLGLSTSCLKTLRLHLNIYEDGGYAVIEGHQLMWFRMVQTYCKCFLFFLLMLSCPVEYSKPQFDFISGKPRMDFPFDTTDLFLSNIRKHANYFL